MEDSQIKPNMTFMVYQPKDKEILDKTKDILNGKSFLQQSIKEILEIRANLRSEKEKLDKENPYNLQKKRKIHILHELNETKVVFLNNMIGCMLRNIWILGQF